MPVRRHPYDAGWCSKQGLTCALVIILCGKQIHIYEWLYSLTYWLQYSIAKVNLELEN